MSTKKIAVLGVTGMLGHVVFERLSRNPGFQVRGTARSESDARRWFPADSPAEIRCGIDADEFESLAGCIREWRPDAAILCIGIVKQLRIAEDPVVAIGVNALLPHKVARICRETNTRLIHIGTDCVFDGRKGNYAEGDRPNAVDLYGRTKALGEVGAPDVTLRTSIIGHELKGKLGLLEWFLSQETKVRGFTRAIYTGFPTVELARVIEEYVLPNPGLQGLYHVSSEPISKHDLLVLISRAYGRDIEIEPDPSFACDRSLDSTAFREKTGYRPPDWPELVERMRGHFANSGIPYSGRINLRG